jgi:hypothetical protein
MREYMLHTMELPSTKTAPFNPQQAASRKYPLQFLCNLANAVLDDETGDLLKSWHLIKHPKYKATWSNSFGTEIQHLTTRTETIFFVDKKEIPQDRQQDITYSCICCNYCEQKKDAYQTRINMGGNLINYPGDCGTPTVDLLTVKLLLNSVISKPYAKFMCIDIKDFYLCTPMSQYKYFRMKLELFPNNINKEYNLRNKVDARGNVHCEVCQGMYELPQAGIFVQELLKERLLKAGYKQSKITPGYWAHQWQPISFALVVIKYIGKEHAQHLINTLKQDYEIKEDWDGNQYLVITLDWDYKKCKVHLSMLDYVEKALARFRHTPPIQLQNQPHKHHTNIRSNSSIRKE